MSKFIKTFEQPDEVIKAFADDLGYQEQIRNEEYVQAEGNETMDDPKGETEEVEGLGDEKITVIKQVPNPEYKPAIGERIIDNPKTREQHVSDACDELIAVWLMKFAERNALANAQNQVKEGVNIQLKALKASIVTEIK